MAIQHRRGNFADFDPFKMVPGEWAFPLDRGEGYYCISPGDVRRVATKEEIIEILETNQQAYDGLQQLLTELEDETVLTGILADISQLLDDVAINKSNIATNTQDIADLDTRVSANTQDVADLDTRVSSHMAEIASNLEFYEDDIVVKKPIRKNAWIDATLQNGYTGSLKYRRNQTGQLELSINVIPGTTTSGTLVGVLPAGFRPGTDTVCRLYYSGSGVGVESDAELLIGLSGSIYIRGTIRSGGYRNSIVLP